jgi:hypothetical protein
MKIQAIPMLHHCFQSQKWHPKVDVLGRFDGAFSQVPLAQNFDMSWLA